jgi:hypothetical protein
MKSGFSLTTALALGLLLALSGLVFAGCKTRPKVDWNSRVGNYTYDQAVSELGPPDKSAKLSDGKTVAEWISHSHRGGFSFGVGTGFYGGHSSVGVGQSIGTGYGDKVLRLTFGLDNKLLSWSGNY